MLTPACDNPSRHLLRICPGEMSRQVLSGSANGNGNGKENLLSLEALAQKLAVPEASLSNVVWQLPGGGWLELEHRELVTSLPQSGSPAVPSTRDMMRTKILAGAENSS